MKKRSYGFSTDNKLCIKTWDKRIAELTQRSPASALGRKYYEVFPRIFVDDDDGLLLSLKTKKDLFLKEYCFQCFRGHIKADVLISSSRADDRKSTAVKVNISPLSRCPIEKKLQEAQPFIDIGKDSFGTRPWSQKSPQCNKGRCCLFKGKVRDGTDPDRIC